LQFEVYTEAQAITKTNRDGIRVARFFLIQYTTKLSNGNESGSGRNIFQMDLKSTLSIPRPSKIYPNIDFLV
jgi:hypothetical protein